MCGQPVCIHRGLPTVGDDSLHSSWTKTDPFLKAVAEDWRVMARALPSVPDMVIQGIFPWCLTPELYATKPEYIDSLAAFVRGRPVPPLDAFLQESEAVFLMMSRRSCRPFIPRP